MNYYSMTEYAPLFVDKEKAKQVYQDLMDLDPSNNDIEIDVTGIESMTTLCAKIIFGKLARTLGLTVFYKRIVFRGLSDEVELVIEMGIDSAMNDDFEF